MEVRIPPEHIPECPQMVIPMLVDIVRKNGFFLLNIPLMDSGTMDDKERSVLEGITEWMNRNRECIYQTRPWHICGAGPQSEQAHLLNAQGFNEDWNGGYTHRDLCFTKKDNSLYAVL